MTQHESYSIIGFCKVLYFQVFIGLGISFMQRAARPHHEEPEGRN